MGTIDKVHLITLMGPRSQKKWPIVKEKNLTFFITKKGKIEVVIKLKNFLLFLGNLISVEK